jgi:GT2 family glycosyltransferase
MIATPTWFGALIRTLLDAAPKTIVTGQVLASDTEAPGSFAPSTKSDETPEVYEGRVGADVLYTGNMALYRSTINEVGGFDERLGPGAPFPAAEDNDLGYRLLEAGYRIFYEPRAVLYHRAWRTENDYLPLCWNYGHGQGAYYAKYLSLRDRYMLRRMGKEIMQHTSQLAVRAWRGRRLAYDDAVYVLGLLYGATRWLLTQPRRPS